ncbi:MAG: ATP-binding protein, partial [Armatimonadota bacterium]|nr:ATP-binding protein [Armatimonadota bacterium]
SPSGLVISNAIYREVIPREITYVTQLNFESTYEPSWYILPDGRLDMEKLLSAFGEFFREHSEHWVERFDYKEAGPQLLIQAFFQRIINGGGRVEREYGLGRKRTDLLLIWPLNGRLDNPGVQRQKVVLELKIVHHSLERTITEGLEQTASYMDRSGTEEGHLIVFDRDPHKPWDEKIFRREESFEGWKITVWGM